jgi:hypothetical protein
MKIARPHLWRKFGCWFCACSSAFCVPWWTEHWDYSIRYGMGRTPVEAYREWLDKYYPWMECK